jgi:hypothetical protein
MIRVVTSSHARLRLTRAGGLAGIRTEATLDTAELDPGAAQRVLAALDTTDLGAPARAATPGPPDTFAYQLDVERGDERHHLAFGELDAPESLRPVLDLLSQRAEPVSR